MNKVTIFRSKFITAYLNKNSDRLNEADRILGLYFAQSDQSQYPRLKISSVNQRYKKNIRLFIKLMTEISMELKVRDNVKIISSKPLKTRFDCKSSVFHLTVTLMAEVDRLMDELEKLELISFDYQKVNELLTTTKSKFYQMMDLFFKIARSIKLSRNGKFLVVDIASIELAEKYTTRT
ncbi:hypothetical protein UA32_12700 [Photobacterium angustum]|uniref:Replication protein n=1 Tax=Photobacterium angustum TaxID=661 RepID=A0ABX5H222_PHOAN|nr:hypothetical protein [Photobacterium angustum]KJG37803.1 hypothetical protein UA32_12700 [Photobacterium angustum]PSX07075.1 hypothetical protein C0W27_16020 [Photobacterium angustum]